MFMLLCCYYAIISGCSHCKHNDITSFLCPYFCVVMSLVWTRLCTSRRSSVVPPGLLQFSFAVILQIKSISWSVFFLVKMPFFNTLCDICWLLNWTDIVVSVKQILVARTLVLFIFTRMLALDAISSGISSTAVKCCKQNDADVGGR